MNEVTLPVDARLTVSDEPGSVGKVGGGGNSDVADGRGGGAGGFVADAVASGGGGGAGGVGGKPFRVPEWRLANVDDGDAAAEV